MCVSKAKMTTTHTSSRKVFHIQSISFNSDRSFFTVSMDEGVRVYNTDPLQLYHTIDPRTCGSISIAEQWDSSCIVVMSAARGARAVFHDNAARVYSCEDDEFGLELRMTDTVLNILVRDEKIALVTERDVRLFHIQFHPLPEGKSGVCYMTCPNELGLCQMSHNHAVEHVLCFPGSIIGSVQIVPLSPRGSERSVRSAIKAHQGPLQCLRLSSDGRFLATASRTGTLIRLWCTTSHYKLMEFRRGIDQALIYDLDISPDNVFMACVSDKQTVHVFALKDTQLNLTSNLSGLTPKTSYTDSQWGMTQFTVHGLVDCRITVRPDGSVVVVTKDGRYYKYLFSRDGHSAQCKRVAYELYSDLAPPEGCYEDTAARSRTTSPMDDALTAAFADAAAPFIDSTLSATATASSAAKNNLSVTGATATLTHTLASEASATADSTTNVPATNSSSNTRSFSQGRTSFVSTTTGPDSGSPLTLTDTTAIYADTLSSFNDIQLRLDSNPATFSTKMLASNASGRDDSPPPRDRFSPVLGPMSIHDIWTTETSPSKSEVFPRRSFTSHCVTSSPKTDQPRSSLVSVSGLASLAESSSLDSGSSSNTVVSASSLALLDENASSATRKTLPNISSSGLPSLSETSALEFRNSSAEINLPSPLSSQVDAAQTLVHDVDRLGFD